jgi:hypothetical protein
MDDILRGLDFCFAYIDDIPHCINSSVYLYCCMNSSCIAVHTTCKKQYTLRMSI